MRDLLATSLTAGHQRALELSVLSVCGGVASYGNHTAIWPFARFAHAK